LQEDVREAACRRPDVQAFAAGDGDRERIQGVRELHAAASDVGVIRREQGDLGVVRHGRAGFGHRPAADHDLGGKNQRPCPLAGGGQSALHDELIEANPSQCP